MIRRPLRPLAEILPSRWRGDDPDVIEQDNLLERRRMAEAKVRRKTQRRLWMLSGMFASGMMVLGVQMVSLALQDPSEPRARASASPVMASRSDILDRNGRILATNIETFSLYAHPQQIVDKPAVIAGLMGIFPDLDSERLTKELTGAREFVWVKKTISPEEKQAVHDMGDPGLLFGPREMRLYPNGTLASHVLGGYKFDNEGTYSADVIGVAGVEKAFDTYLRDPKFKGQPLQLSIDLTVQSKLETVLSDSMKPLNAKGASAVLMDVHTGEIISIASFPDFDPNDRPSPLVAGDPADSPLFNRAIQGVYELGSALKPFTLAQGLELGIIGPKTVIDTKGPLKWGKFKIRDFDDYGPRLTAEKVLIKSSNIGTARIAMQIGNAAQKDFLGSLGLLEATSVEVIEGPTGRPQFPSNWSEISTMTISYGHGISTSPIHLAAAYSTMVNGGTLVKPTLLRKSQVEKGERILSEQTSLQMRKMLRKVVTEGTASLGEVDGYAVGGKTGTADKPNNKGGYHKEKVLSTFASIFPSHSPQYALIVTLDEPEDRSGDKPKRTAGWTAVPVASEIIRRVGPLLGIAQSIEPIPQGSVTLVTSQ